MFYWAQAGGGIGVESERKNSKAIRIVVLQNWIVATALVRCSQNPENIWKVECDINILYEEGVNK